MTHQNLKQTLLTLTFLSSLVTLPLTVWSATASEEDNAATSTSTEQTESQKQMYSSVPLFTETKTESAADENEEIKDYDGANSSTPTKVESVQFKEKQEKYVIPQYRAELVDPRLLDDQPQKKITLYHAKLITPDLLDFDAPGRVTNQKDDTSDSPFDHPGYKPYEGDGFFEPNRWNHLPGGFDPGHRPYDPADDSETDSDWGLGFTFDPEGRDRPDHFRVDLVMSCDDYTIEAECPDSYEVYDADGHLVGSGRTQVKFKNGKFFCGLEGIGDILDDPSVCRDTSIEMVSEYGSHPLTLRDKRGRSK